MKPRVSVSFTPLGPMSRTSGSASVSPSPEESLPFTSMRYLAFSRRSNVKASSSPAGVMFPVAGSPLGWMRPVVAVRLSDRSSPGISETVSLGALRAEPDAGVLQGGYLDGVGAGGVVSVLFDLEVVGPRGVGVQDDLGVAAGTAFIVGDVAEQVVGEVEV